MRNILLSMVLVWVSFISGKAQYYYDRSKNPDKNTGKISSPKIGRDFDHFFFLSWDNNTPLSNKDFISQASNLGAKLGYRKRINEDDKLWAGADFGWAVYRQYIPTQTYTSGTQSVTTDLYNYAYNYSLTLNVDYFFLPMEKLFVPYAGVGIGAAYDKFAQYFNIYGTDATSWGFLVRPEAGILIGFKENSSWRLKAAYHYDYASNTSTDFAYKNFTNVGFQVGIVKMAW
jgi:hypothetical protein